MPIFQVGRSSPAPPSHISCYYDSIASYIGFTFATLLYVLKLPPKVPFGPHKFLKLENCHATAQPHLPRYMHKVLIIMFLFLFDDVEYKHFLGRNNTGLPHLFGNTSNTLKNVCIVCYFLWIYIRPKCG